MSVEQIFESFFKPETRKSGSDYFLKNSVVLSSKTDTHIQGYVKGSTSCRVSFSTDSISSESFSADCSCPTSAKGQLCKHMWSVLLSVEKNYPDFLTSKISVEKVTKLDPKQSAFKEKQNDYRKLQYEKQKLRAKKIKIEKSKQKFMNDEPEFPTFVESALAFFSENGFPFERPIQEEDLNNARKKLARVFHPDIGGSHEETVVLNKNHEILMRFFYP